MVKYDKCRKKRMLKIKSDWMLRICVGEGKTTDVYVVSTTQPQREKKK